MRVPILILSDAPSASSGLGRICRELALQIHTNLSDLYDVATLGYGGIGDRNLPFPQYIIEGMSDWYIPTLKEVWDNFAGKRRGVVLTIWDASRLLWFARPDNAGWCPNREMREWLQKPPFERWGYFPMDAEGPNGMLSRINAECVVGFDRIIAYSEWAKAMIAKTLSPADCEKRSLVAIPHGIDTTIFHPKPHLESRGVFRSDLQFNGPVLEEYEKIVGIVATNQSRKDYGLAIAALAEVAKDNPIRIFIQSDILERHWSIPGLLFDFNIIHRCILSTMLVTDEVMAKIYSACDMTLGIGPEGFGFPIFESLACGTPVLAGACGGHVEHLPNSMTVQPQTYRLEGCYQSVRPVYDVKKFAYWIAKMLKEKKTGASLLPERLAWPTLWANEWEPHFRALHRNLVPSSVLSLSENSSNTMQMDNPPVEKNTTIVAFPVQP